MSILFFYVSMAILILMVGSKVFERKVRKIEFLSSAFTKGDTKIQSFTDVLIGRYNHLRKIANLFIFDFLPSYFYELLVRTKDFVAKKYYEAGTDFRGKRILKSTGSVSFFLEQLSEDKN